MHFRMIGLVCALLASGAFADEASLRGVGDKVCRVDAVGEIANGG